MTSLTSGGSWTNDQHTGEAVDPTGLTFEVHYADGTSASVSPQAHTPSVWGDTAGTQTCTFTYTEDGESVSCAVEATVTEPAVTITGLSVTGTMPTQTIGDYEDYSGLDFAVSLSNGQTVHLDWDTDIEPAFSADPILGSHSDWIDTNDWVWQEYQGSDTVTDLQFYIDPSENSAYWATQDVVVSSRITFNWPTSFQLQSGSRTLTSLSVTGDFTDTQYTGSAPTVTGLTVKAVYDNGDEESLSSSDYSVSPVLWDASGNPNNLGEQTATFSYTEDGVTKTATKAVVIHRPSSGQVLNMNQEGWLYFDMPAEMKTLMSGSFWGPSGLFTGDTASIGDSAFFVLTDSEYQNDTPVTAQVLGGWMSEYGLGSQGETFAEVGTPNESGFKPGYGPQIHTDLDDCYVAVRTDGTATMSAGDVTAYVVIGTLANALDGTSYKLSDMSTTGRTVYSAICRKS